MADKFDVAVLGGGPGGYVAAIRAAQLGARVVLAEKDRLGGTCLVRGCIPTKALLQSSELYGQLARRGPEFGVQASGLSFDLAAAQRRQTKVVDAMVGGVAGLLRSAGVTVLQGAAALKGGGRFEVAGAEVLAADIVIATGSAASTLPIPGAELTIDSDAILELREVPAAMVVIGGGVVGMEWGALYAALGTRVTVLEMLPEILPMVEADLVRAYRKHFATLGAEVHTGARVMSVAREAAGLAVTFNAGGEEGRVEADVVLRATGRVPYTSGLGLEGAGVATERGRVVVDDHLRTSSPGVWAVGDVIGGIMLAHVASYEGVCAVENITGHQDRVPDYHAAPNCIYTDPEIAHVGLGEAEAKARGIEVRVGRFPFTASGRAMTLGQTDGFVKVVAGVDGTVLGVHMVGPRVTDVIAEATLAVQKGLTLADLDLTIHAHPTLAESLLEAALAAEGRAIHVANLRRTSSPLRAPAPVEPAPAAAAPAERSELSSPVTAEERPPNGSGSGSAPIDLDRLELKKQNREELLRLYRLMYLIRRFEERAQNEYTKARIGGYCHLNLGEEATVVGGVLPLAPGDYVFTSYREHGHAIARGVDPKAVMAELFGRETGVAHGRGGSMHIFDYGLRFMGGYGIVGGHLPLAVGAGFSIKYRQARDIAFCMFGDGASNIGAFHESLNFSKVFELPVVWFCVNNQYGMGTAVDRASAVKEIYRKACAYDIEAVRVDGMDVLEVLATTAAVVARTRADSAPRFIEAVNYRFKGHSVVDPDKYRSEAEKQEWLKSDPVVKFESELTRAKVATEAEFRTLRAEVDAEVEEAIEFADASPDPAVEDLYRYVYAGEFEAVGADA